MNVGIVIQGDIRANTELIVEYFQKHFDCIILSTWQGEPNISQYSQCKKILTPKPKNNGLSNRNLQRLSTSRGIRAAKDSGCDYVLKWRTDMFPLGIDVPQLLKWASFDVPDGFNSRIVLPAFRCLTFKPDWFSSIPDLFAFGHINEMELLWGDSEINYDLPINIPNEMQSEFNGENIEINIKSIYHPETELYAFLKTRLMRKLFRNIDHETLLKGHCTLINYTRLKIVWFGKDGWFRSVGQAWEHPWWTEESWRDRCTPVSVIGYRSSSVNHKINRLLSWVKIKTEEIWQYLIWKNYLRKKSLSRKVKV